MLYTRYTSTLNYLAYDNKKNFMSCALQTSNTSNFSHLLFYGNATC